MMVDPSAAVFPHSQGRLRALHYFLGSFR